MDERSDLIESIRSEIVGPSRPLKSPVVVEFLDRIFEDSEILRRGPLSWQPGPDEEPQEVLYHDRESPHRKYGAGLLHPVTYPSPADDEAALEQADTIGIEVDGESSPLEAEDEGENESKDNNEADAPFADTVDDFEVTSPDIRHPSTIGISFCIELDESGQVIVRIPQKRKFVWQSPTSPSFEVNGRYESAKRRWTEDGNSKEAPVWRRVPAVDADLAVAIERTELVAGRVIRKDVPMPANSPISLRVEVFPRSAGNDRWLLTTVLRNSTNVATVINLRETILYQTFFEVAVLNGRLQRYPESERPFASLDSDEQSLALLYRESATWGIGHGCAAGWEAEPSRAPETIFADVLPATELPSMTPEIEVDGEPVRLTMRDLANLPNDGRSGVWIRLDQLVSSYAAWIQSKITEAKNLSPTLQPVAFRHIESSNTCLRRMEEGIKLLRDDDLARRAFRLANLAMLLQQVATKQLVRRKLGWNSAASLVSPDGNFQSPWNVIEAQLEDTAKLGSWRAFQIAFLLMSLNGVRSPLTPDSDVVDLIWFPTGGGKTEAYLAVVAFYMFHERLLMNDANASDANLRRDGTNVLMRYTLRMLTTQQFQRAASLICAMEFLRRNSDLCGMEGIPGVRFSLALWIGGQGSPNKISDARRQVAEFRRAAVSGNPLILTECPWCRAEIGRFDGTKPSRKLSDQQWDALRTRGIDDDTSEGPRLHCTDSRCEFGQEQPERWLPVEVIDERIYRYPPSLVIATADKFAMIAYRPRAGALFGWRVVQNRINHVARPPGLIIQDELHLISGPLGTMYALYEGIIERFCSLYEAGVWQKPKIIASTATIRGAAEQVKAVYARTAVQLFPSPGLLMGDSFFGKYARNGNGKLSDGRLYLGIHATDYGSVLTTQVRTFAAALFRPWGFSPERRDAWWTLLAFYNSIRELSGAKTLFDSDIRSRLKYLFNREGFGDRDRRNLKVVEELTSRLSQADIVRMMDWLSTPYDVSEPREVLDGCLVSNIIEVGVDIDRLSLMAVVGQPKTTASYIQVTGRVGRRWWERPGLILTVYNPGKSRDRSHFEQFHSYHRRLYERVEPASATPFAVSCVQRGTIGAILTWARQQSDAPVQNRAAYSSGMQAAFELLLERSDQIQDVQDDRQRALEELTRMRDRLEWKWALNPQEWEEFPQNVDGEYLMLWPGQFATAIQRRRGAVVPTSMRQVDRSAELEITQGYVPFPEA